MVARGYGGFSVAPQSLEFLRGEIAEFQRQKKQEAEQFEQYRREETRKLR